MRVTRKGQVIVPDAILKRARLLPNTHVVVEFDGLGVVIRKPRSLRKRSRTIRRLIGRILAPR